MASKIVDMMHAFAHKIGLAEVETEDDGAFGLDIDGIEVYFEPMNEGRTLLVYSPVCPLPEKDPGRAAREMLAANCYFQGTGNASLAADAMGEAVLQQWVETYLIECDDDYLPDELERFVNIAAWWKDRFTGEEYA